ncbi:MAG: UbiD family decarboxylase [Planctomycetota bacterium]
MPHDFLTDFLTKLQDAGELVRVAAPVDAALELAAIVDQVTKSGEGGPAFFFENVKNSSIPVVANLLGSRRRLCLALGVDSLDQASAMMDRLLNGEASSGWLDALKLTAPISPSNRFAPRVIKTAVCQQVVKLGRDVNLWDLPIPRCWPGEANPTLTAAQTLTRHPTTGTEHWGSYPLQVVGPREIVPHWHRQHEGHRHWQTAVRERKQLPVAMSLGGDPLLALSAAAPLPAGVDRGLFAGFLRGTSLDLVKGRSVELDVPAGAEIILEGYIDHAAAPLLAPPIASDSGHYSLPEELPVVQVTAITHRANPVLSVVIASRPPSEASWISLALARLFLPMAQRLIPEIVDWHQPFAGAGRNLLFVSIRKESPQQARRVLNALWGLGHFGQSKLIVVVDADVNVHREEDVWFAVGSHAHPGRDSIFNQGPTAMDDHAAPVRGIGHAVGIDATRKLPDEGHPRDWPLALQHPDELIARVHERLSEFGLDRR